MDPFELTHPPQLEASEIDLEEEPADYHDVFWEEATYSQDTVGYYQGIHVDVCRFDEQGNHIMMARHCPHYEAADEEGPRTRPGWTVQQR